MSKPKVEYVESPTIIIENEKVYVTYICRYKIELDITPDSITPRDTPKKVRRRRVRNTAETKSDIEKDSSISPMDLDIFGKTEEEFKKPGKRDLFNGTIDNMSKIVNTYIELEKKKNVNNDIILDYDISNPAPKWLIDIIFSAQIYNKFTPIFHRYVNIPDIIIETADGLNDELGKKIVNAFNWIRHAIIRSELRAFADMENSNSRKIYTSQRKSAMNAIKSTWPNTFAIYSASLLHALRDVGQIYTDGNKIIPTKNKYAEKFEMLNYKEGNSATLNSDSVINSVSGISQVIENEKLNEDSIKPEEDKIDAYNKKDVAEVFVPESGTTIIDLNSDESIKPYDIEGIKTEEDNKVVEVDPIGETKTENTYTIRVSDRND